MTQTHNLTFEATMAEDFLPQSYESILPELANIHAALQTRTCSGAEFLGWLDLPARQLAPGVLDGLLELANKICTHSQVLIVLGIGGSYLGARAGLEFCLGANYNRRPETPEIYFVGNSLSAGYLQEVINIIGERDFSVNIISKSGTTIETALAWRVFNELLTKKYGVAQARDHLVITTDPAHGALRKLAQKNDYQTLAVPPDVGGRFSVLTPVGLLPLAVAGINIKALLTGAWEMSTALIIPGPTNIAWQYAANRFLLSLSGKSVELLSVYQPALQSLGAWWQQLFGESEGKNGLGLYPDTVLFSTDLHSLGQYVQDGQRQLLETVLWLSVPQSDLTVPMRSDDFDGLNYLGGKTFNYINEQAMQGTIKAHVAGGVPNLLLTAREQDAYTLGQLFYFFEFSVALSAGLLGVNAFDQPGVEAYKKEMLTRLKI